MFGSGSTDRSAATGGGVIGGALLGGGAVAGFPGFAVGAVKAELPDCFFDEVEAYYEEVEA